MQKTWVEEHRISYGRERWMNDIPSAQVQSFQQDVLFVTDSMTFSANFLQVLRSKCPSNRLIIE